VSGGRADRLALDSHIATVDRIGSLLRRRPLLDIPELTERAPYYREWLEHPDYDEYWRRLAPRERFAQVTAPAINGGGWFDLFLGGTLANYAEIKACGATDKARRPSLVIGPWAHGNRTGTFAERSFGVLGAEAGFDLGGLHLRWFDHHLRGLDNGIGHEAPVRLFVMGPDRWREEQDWPLPDTEFRRYHLHSGGHANTAEGDGVLSGEPPGAEPEDTFLYDPLDPVPSVGGATVLTGAAVSANAGPRDQRQVEARTDVLCYTTPPLESDLEVTGPIELALYVSSSATDTDFTGKLVDVSAAGRAEIVADGIIRARYRESLSAPSPLRPGYIYELRIVIGATARVFPAGHRIRLEVSSSNFPRFDRNGNSGALVATEDHGATIAALNHVHHDRHSPSHLVLPVIDRL
jgi:putative CocE/NonD family hydrolase